MVWLDKLVNYISAMSELVQELKVLEESKKASNKGKSFLDQLKD